MVDGLTNAGIINTGLDPKILCATFLMYFLYEHF